MKVMDWELYAEKNKEQIRMVCYLLCAAIFTYIILRIWNVNVVYWDTEIYWRISQNWDEQGIFSFDKYPIEYLYRGYFFPWFLSLIKIGTSGSTNCIWFAISIVVSIFCIYVIPFIIQYITKVEKIFVVWRFIFLFLFLYFYKGLLCYPLSDFYAYFFGMFAFFAGIHAYECRKKEQRIRSLLWILLCGYCGVVTYYIRSNYIFFSMLGIVVLIFAIVKCKKKKSDIIFLMFGLLFGGALAALPQILINYYATNRITPFVMTEGYANISLFDFQLYYGLIYQKYETYVGSDYQFPGMYFLDPVGAKILSLEGIENAEQLGGIWGYLKLILKYPFDFIGIFIRHIVAMVDIRYPEAYITNLVCNMKRILLNYSCLFAGVYSGVIVLKTNLGRGVQEGAKRIVLLMLMSIPSLVLIPGSIETRFGIGLWCTLYGLFCFSNIFSYIKEINRRKKIELIIWYCIFLVIMFTLGGVICGTLQYDTLLYN